LYLVHLHIWEQHLVNLRNLPMLLKNYGTHVVGKIKYLQVLPIVQV
jgi:hypothetical protein